MTTEETPDDVLSAESAQIISQILEQALPPEVGVAVFLFLEDEDGGAKITFLANRQREVVADLVEGWLAHYVYAGHPLSAELQRLRGKLIALRQEYSS